MGGHAVGDGHVIGYDGQLTIRCFEVGGVFDGRQFSPPGVYSLSDHFRYFSRRIVSNVLAGIVPVSDEPARVWR